VKKKIFNDPVYGFINFPHDFLYELIDHPFVQRLRRIRQLGMTDYVYPGASHSRFNHSLGALHLMTQAIQSLRWKGVSVTEPEFEAVSAAILLHDIGHGPFSHALEKYILPLGHEEISLGVMEMMNLEFGGRLDLAIQIFRGQYHKKFLHELVASQLDVDRMDYLNRDSFYSGVVEGMIGYDRIIKMLNVVDDKLVVEEKGVLSVEQFLMARRIMYWQVYLHKTVLAVEKMTWSLVRYLHDHPEQGYQRLMSDNLAWFFVHFKELINSDTLMEEGVRRFMDLDDTDLLSLVKMLAKYGKGPVKMLAEGIVHRRIFRVVLKSGPFPRDLPETIRHRIVSEYGVQAGELDYLILEGSE